MALMKTWKMTQKRLAAVRRAQKLSHGPLAARGRRRIPAAHQRQEDYSEAEKQALEALGEDSAHFQALVEGLRDKQTALATLQEHLAQPLAQALWRMQRAGRMLDGHALRQAKEENYAREARLHMRMMRLKMTSRSWQLLAQSVARERYVTTRADLEMMKNLHKEGVAKEMSEVALALFWQLRAPGVLGPGDPGFEDEEAQEQQRRVLIRIKEIFGLATDNDSPRDASARAGQGWPQQECPEDDGDTETDGASEPSPAPENVAPRFTLASENVTPDFSPADADLEAGATQAPADLEADTSEEPEEEANPYPSITEAEWEAREQVRQLLENILSRQVRIFDDQHRDLLRQVLAGPSPYERAAEIAPTDPTTLIMQRIADSHCRHFLRMTGTLIRIRRQERQMRDDERLSAR